MWEWVVVYLLVKGYRRKAGIVFENIECVLVHGFIDQKKNNVTYWGGGGNF